LIFDYQINTKFSRYLIKDKITEIFVVADDFCKKFSAEN